MIIYFATDHAGFALKEALLPFVRDELRHEVVDLGAFIFDESDDYPDYIKKAAELVSENPMTTRAIILGGSGQGEAMVANRFRHVRAALYYGHTEEIVPLSREHNDANVLSLGARFMSVDEAKRAVRAWLTAPFSEDERHVRRIKKIDS